MGPMPGLEEALAALRRRGIPFGVVSSSWRWYVGAACRELGMYEDAAVIVTGSDGLPSSPPALIRRRPGLSPCPARRGAGRGGQRQRRPLRRSGGSGLRGGIQPRLGGAGSVPRPGGG